MCKRSMPTSYRTTKTSSNTTARFVVTLAAVLFAAQLAVAAGSYSDYNDTTNAIDPAIPARIDGQINPIFTAWASGYTDYLPAPSAYAQWQTPENILAAPDGDIVSLGDLDQAQINAGGIPGRITLTFAKSIYNGPGADFAVFENGSYYNLPEYNFVGFLAELGYVEVSSNGTDFVRFPCVSQTPQPEGDYSYLLLDSTDIFNLAGKHDMDHGTPFDLDDVAAAAAVVNGLVDINDIQYVKIVDVPGSGDFLDSNDNPIYDAWWTYDSGGMDLNAVGAINTVPEPSSLALLAAVALGLAGYRVVRRPK